MRFLKIFSMLILFWPSLVLAQSFPSVPLYEVDNLDIDIQISQSGNVEVIEEFKTSVPTQDFIWSKDETISNLKIFNNGIEVSQKNYSIKKDKGKLIIQAKDENASQRWTITYRADGNLKPFSNLDRLSMILILEPDVFINQFQVAVHLPLETDKNQIKQRVYAIHGVGSNKSSVKDEKTLEYSGSTISPLATFTIQAEWPKGIIKYPPLKKLLYSVQSLGLKFWLEVAIVLAVLGFLVYFYMVWRQKREIKSIPLTYLNKPPENVPPALVGLLLRQRAAQREIAATVIDLAQRGFLYIVKKREEYILGKRPGQAKDTLRPFEAYLYDKLFTQQGEVKIKRTEFELESRAVQQFYSPKISKFYQFLYQEAQKRNYFIRNPFLAILRYRMIGILFFLCGILIAVIGIKISSGPPFILFASFGLVFASILIIKAASFVPKRTTEGKRALAAWLSFAKYLSDKRPVRILVTEQDLFNRYFVYSVALGKEIDWASRFVHCPFSSPSWYVSSEEVTLEGFVASIFYITGSLSQTLYNIREPSV
ncbi:MAG: DUF2207 domain-containing protein [Candidatus Berkelbacteria bacterium]|nr:DUF2207 domain-containing protein [Candidatus Berkelbacteria bacterium]